MKRSLRVKLLVACSCLCAGIQVGAMTIPVRQATIQGEKASTTKEEADPNAKNKLSVEDLRKIAEKERKEAAKNIQESLQLSNKKGIDEYVKDPNGYLIDYSATKMLKNNEYTQLTKKLVELAKNEIYARHGYIFTDLEYKKIFSTKKWYKPTVKDINKIQLSDVETFNVKCLQWWLEVGEKSQLFPEAEDYTACYCFKDNEKFSMDIDGDGKKEEIELKGNVDEDPMFLKDAAIYINGKKAESLSGLIRRNLWVIDIDPKDAYQELLVYNGHYTSTYHDNYYFYDGKKLNFMGKIDGHLNENNYIKDQVLYGAVADNLLGSKYYRKEYKLNDKHQWQSASDYVSISIPIMANEAIDVFKENSEDSTRKTYPAGTTFTTIETDLKEWVKVKVSDGTEGWIRHNDKNQSNWVGGLYYCG